MFVDVEGTGGPHEPSLESSMGAHLGIEESVAPEHPHQTPLSDGVVESRDVGEGPRHVLLDLAARLLVHHLSFREKERGKRDAPDCQCLCSHLAVDAASAPRPSRAGLTCAWRAGYLMMQSCPVYVFLVRFDHRSDRTF